MYKFLDCIYVSKIKSADSTRSVNCFALRFWVFCNRITMVDFVVSLSLYLSVSVSVCLSVSLSLVYGQVLHVVALTRDTI